MNPTTPPIVARLTYSGHDGTLLDAEFKLKHSADGLRTYAQSSTAPMREGAPSHIEYSEIAGLPVVRSGSLAFDALFAHAITEMRENSVPAIRDSAYNAGQPIPCECFETGEKWNYVWTRDLSYAANLGLAMLDPHRVRNSLQFKLSGFRPGITKAPGVAGSNDGLQIIQDTGSGGSWPVSTDRVSWAFGAEEALAYLDPSEREVFAPIAFKALANTIENDRLAAFDPRDGLYTGEQSFLDWREQTYGMGIAHNLSHMASAKALSTNVAHYKALTLASRLALELGHGAQAARYADWAATLNRAINARLWLEDAGMYASLTAPHFDGAPLHKFDWLGLSLAIVTGVADEQQAKRILASYPHGPAGAPVIYPQQPDVPVYHNRAIWPFVTAYGLNAAVAGRNVSVADAAYASLIRGAALHLSNMENMEWLSGMAQFSDPAQPGLAGPVINSRRQLWSVGAYLGMVIKNVFGLQADSAGLAIRPFITATLRREIFSGSSAITLERLKLRDHKIRVRIALPPSVDGTGVYSVAAVRLNGQVIHGEIPWDHLLTDNTVDVELGPLQAGEQQIRRVSGSPFDHLGAHFAPREPRLTAGTNKAGEVTLTLEGADEMGSMQRYALFRNGSVIRELPASATWTEKTSAGAACYSAAAISTSSGNSSHHSPPLVIAEALEVPVDDFRVASNLTLTASATPYLKDWGRPEDQLTIRRIAIADRNRIAIQLRYTNHGHAINTGISNGVKRLVVKSADGRTVAHQVVQMPHLPPESPPALSTPAEFMLERGSYTIEVEDFFNMSYLDSNALYEAGGGKLGPRNMVDLYGIRIVWLR